MPDAKTLMVRVARKTSETPDVCVFELVATDDRRELPPFSAGAHVDVHVPGGPLRQYSLCNDPRETGRYVIAVLRDASSRGGSVSMHERTCEGDVLKIGLPRNRFPLLPAGRTLLFAGGIGITPMLSMAEQLAHEGQDFSLHYCVRSQERTAFLQRLKASRFSDRVSYHFDDGDASQRLNAAAILQGPHDDSRLYVCGPGGFMKAIVASAQASGWMIDRIHSEAFEAGVMAADGESFELVLRRSGCVYRVPPEKSVAQVLVAAGFAIPLSCESGVCGTCLMPVLEGTPDHRDSFLMPDERARNDCFTPCCSRALGPRLVLDL